MPAGEETFQEAAQRVLDVGNASYERMGHRYPKKHILNEGITGYVPGGTYLMLCGMVLVLCSDGEWHPPIDFHLLADVEPQDDICERCADAT